MGVLRVLRTAQLTLSHTFYSDEAATNASTGVTVTARRLDGTVAAGPTAATNVATGVYTWALPAQAELDILLLSWVADSIAGVVTTQEDTVEIVGGFLFNLAVARKRYNWPPQKYPTSFLAEMRTQVEQECEDICGWAFVPRFTREVLNGTGTSDLLTPHLLLRKVRAVAVGGVVFDAAALATVVPTAAGILSRPSGWWPAGVANVVVEYEHGHTTPPVEISTNAAYRLRTLLAVPDTIVDERATSYTVQDGGTYRLALPGEKKTGVPTIDAAYHRNGMMAGSFA